MGEEGKRRNGRMDVCRGNSQIANTPARNPPEITHAIIFPLAAVPFTNGMHRCFSPLRRTHARWLRALAPDPEAEP